MPVPMSETETETFLGSSTELDTYDYRNEEDVDDYISAILYKTGDGRYFRYVSSSGMDSEFVGAGEFGEWLTAEEAKEWTRF